MPLVRVSSAADEAQHEHEQTAEQEHGGEGKINFESRAVDDDVPGEAEEGQFAEDRPEEADEQEDEAGGEDEGAHGVPWNPSEGWRVGRGPNKSGPPSRGGRAEIGCGNRI